MRELGVRLFEGLRNDKALKMSKGQEQLPPSEHHFRWLLYVSAIVLALGGAFLLYVQLVQPEAFDEGFARQLLERHDPGLSQEEFFSEFTLEDGQEFANHRFIGLARDNGTLFAAREAVVTFDIETNETLRAAYLRFGSEPLGLRPSRSWSCPYGTYLNLTLETTGRYRFIGLSTSYLPTLLFKGFLEQQRSKLDERLEQDYTETIGNNFELALGLASGADLTKVWYFSPDEQELHDQQLAKILEGTAECTEVTQ
jgi:hypothetical protein